jgi:phenylacetate-CoA ligase
VFRAALAQLRFAASLVFGVSFDLVALERLVDALAETRREFGAIGPDGAEALGGPALDERDRREIQRRRFRAQATRGARETAYYSDLFRRTGLDPATLGYADIARLPPTPQEAIRDDPDAFLRRLARPVLRATSTGTTGRPTGVGFSAYELRVAILLGAIGMLFDGSVTAEDIVQISTSSRATLGNTCFAGSCARVGALVCPVGLVEPELTLGLLAEERRIPGKKPKVSVLLTYPSYLGELVERGPALGYAPADFGLERIGVGGEVVTAGLKARCHALFGPVAFDEGYGTTEIWPFGGTRCPQGHLHFEPSRGLLEVLAPDTAAPAEPGAIGTIVATPFPPYRDAAVVLRYDTEDLVRALEGPPACGLRRLPAVGAILGKRRLAVRHERGWTCPRDVLEALEALAEVPLPARCGFWGVPGGVAVEVVARGDGPAARRAIGLSLEERGVPVRELRVVADRAKLRQPLPLRGDLREVSFALPGSTSRPPVGGGEAGSAQVRAGTADG